MAIRKPGRLQLDTLQEFVAACRGAGAWRVDASCVGLGPGAEFQRTRFEALDIEADRVLTLELDKGHSLAIAWMKMVGLDVCGVNLDKPLADRAKELLEKLENSGLWWTNPGEAIELDPAPGVDPCACGEMAAVWSATLRGVRRWRVECGNCDERGPDCSERREAVERWNEDFGRRDDE